MKIFIDAGFYAGKALDYYAPLMDDSWIVYIFEPNMDLPLDIERFPFGIIYRPEAVWIEFGEVDLVLTGRNDASYVGNLKKDEGDKVRVPAIDFSQFVDELPEDATIICSMDCEGSEFPVLEKMLRDGTAKRLSLLDIEFHHRNVEGYTKEDADRIIRALQSEGVLVKLKVPLEV